MDAEGYATDPIVIAEFCEWLASYEPAPRRAEPRLDVRLAVDAGAALGLADLLGEIAADLWLAGSFELD